MSSLKECLYGAMPPKPKKNFLKENVKQLRNLQKKVEETKKIESKEKEKRGFKAVNFRRVNGVRKAEVYLASTESSSSSTTTSSSSDSGSEIRQLPTSNFSSLRGSRTKTSSVHRCTSPQPPKELKHKAVQTVLNSSEMNEGNVRYASKQNRGAGGDVDSKTSVEVSPVARRANRGDSPSERGSPTRISHPPEEDQNKTEPVNYVKQNAMIHFKEKVPQMKTDPTRAPPNYKRGVVPKYLQGVTTDKKPENVKTRGKSECPPGHIEMSENDRLEHLRMIRQQYADLVQQLNNLPVRTDSFKARTRKMEIEKELDKLEKGIKVFSMDKLYVKVA